MSDISELTGAGIDESDLHAEGDFGTICIPAIPPGGKDGDILKLGPDGKMTWASLDWNWRHLTSSSEFPRGEVPITLAEAKARIEALELRCGELRQLIVDVINGKIEIGDPDV